MSTSAETPAITTSAVTTTASNGDITAAVTTASSGGSTSTSTTQAGDGIQRLEEQVAQLEAEQAELQRVQREKELQERVRVLLAENAALRARTSASVSFAPVTSVTAPSAAAISATSPSTAVISVTSPSTAVTSVTANTAPTAMPSLAELRQMDHLNDEVNRQIYGNANAAAISSPMSAPGTLPEPQGTPITTASATAQGKKVFSPENFARRPGLAELPYNRLSVQEFVVGSLRIVLQHSSAEVSEREKRARLQHILELMILASTYNWPAVRALYGTALKEIDKGHRQWADSLLDLKEEMLRPTDVTRTAATLSDKDGGICKAYNYGREGCTRGAKCTYRHVCEECFEAKNKEEKHKAKACPEGSATTLKND